MILAFDLEGDNMRYRIEKVEQPPLIEGHLKMGSTNGTRSIDVNSRYLLKDKNPWIPIMGEFHYLRTDRVDWEKELLKMKAGGITAVSFYTIWIYHEEIEGIFDFSGNKDLGYFVELCDKCGLDVVLRIGPWVHGEVRNGGFPDWLCKKECQLRSDDPEYLLYVTKFYHEIYDQVKGRLFNENGNIIIIQIENELVDNGAHLLTLKNLAKEIGLNAPIYTVTGWNSEYGAEIPEYDMIPVFGGYSEAPWENHINKLEPSIHYFFTKVRNDSSIGADLLEIFLNKDIFKMRYELYPFATCEIGGGIQVTYSRRPDIAPDDIASIAMVKLGCGNNLPGYYMFHGGTNGIGEHSTLQESKHSGYPNDLPIRNYDFQAPIGEFGLIRDQYRKLKLQHLFLEDLGNLLAPMDAYFPEKQITKRNDKDSLRFSIRTNGKSGFVFVNNYQRLDDLNDHKNVQFEIPLESGFMVFPKVGITVCNGDYFILPFNLEISGLNLSYATAQFLCRNKDTYFFFAPMGLKVEYLFDTELDITDDNEVARNINIIREDKNKTLVEVSEPGMNCVITIKKEDQSSIRIVTLTNGQAEHLYRLEEEIYITNGDMYSIGNNVVSYRLGDNDLSYHTWTQNGFLKSEQYVDTKYETINYERVATLSFMSEYFNEFYLGQHEYKPNIQEWEFSIDEQLLEGLQDAFLKIDYVGDVIQIYANGILAADDFYRGCEWLVSIMHLLRYGKDIRIVISELVGMNIYLEKGKGRGLELCGIEYIPMYQL